MGAQFQKSHLNNFTFLSENIIIVRQLEMNDNTNFHHSQCGGIWSLVSGASLMRSSILKIVMAASVANLIELIFEIMGSKTPAFRLFLGLPLIRSKPQNLSSIFFWSSSPSLCEAVWSVLSLEISSVASLAALVAKVLGITFKASLNSEIAICSLLLYCLEKASRWMLKATSTAPPPATTCPDSRVLLATQMESWRDLN